MGWLGDSFHRGQGRWKLARAACALSTVPWPTFCRKYLSILLVDTPAMSSAVKPLLQQCCTLHPTGEAIRPNHIPLHNIIYNVTVIGQTPLNIGNETFSNNIRQWWLTWYKWRRLLWAVLGKPQTLRIPVLHALQTCSIPGSAKFQITQPYKL